MDSQDDPSNSGPHGTRGDPPGDRGTRRKTPGPRMTRTGDGAAGRAGRAGRAGTFAGHRRPPQDPSREGPAPAEGPEPAKVPSPQKARGPPRDPRKYPPPPESRNHHERRSSPGASAGAGRSPRSASAPARCSPNKPSPVTGSPRPAAPPRCSAALRPSPAATPPTAPRAARPRSRSRTSGSSTAPSARTRPGTPAYLLFLDPERMLRSFRLNYGETSAAEPLGGWEKPDSQIRGHMTGHLLSGLALTYANTNDDADQNPRPLPGQPARRAPGQGGQRRLPPRLPVRLPRALLRPARAGRRADLVAVLHDPQVPGRDDRPVPAGRRRPGAGRGRSSWPTGSTGARTRNGSRTTRCRRS